MNLNKRHILAAMLILAFAAAFLIGRPWADSLPEVSGSLGRLPRLHPDYTGLTLPPNIGPMSFVVQEDLSSCMARFSGPAGDAVAFTVKGDGGRILIPPEPWARLLQANRGRDIGIDIYTRNAAGQWARFDTVRNTVAAEDIDSHLVFRALMPNMHAWGDVGLYQRDLTTNRQEPLLVSTSINGNCCNCHTFAQNRPDTMLLHIRSDPAPLNAGTLILKDGKLVKVDTKTTRRPSPAGFASWHPSRLLLATSVNRIKLFAHAAGPTIVDQIDTASEMAIFDLRSGAMVFPEALRENGQLTTYPCWSPDGKTLYFCRSHVLWDDPWGIPIIPPQFRQMQYDLAKISYDLATNTWGRIETVLSAQKVGKSLLEPRVSPDGRYVMFSTTEYGDVPIFHNDSDLYLLDLSNGQWRKMDCNSDETEGWHCWSSNGRWFVFTSRRGDGGYARPYFCHLGKDGKETKPFVMPQDDPTFYDSLLKTYNLPELITGPVSLTQRQIAAVVRQPAKSPSSMPVTGATPKR